MTVTIAAYDRALKAGPREICVALRKAITSAMPGATSKVWLEAIGSFHAAQIRYQNAEDVDVKVLARWLEKAKTDIWDSVAYRRQAMAKAKRRKTAPRRPRTK